MIFANNVEVPVSEVVGLRVRLLPRTAEILSIPLDDLEGSVTNINGPYLWVATDGGRDVRLLTKHFEALRDAVIKPKTIEEQRDLALNTINKLQAGFPRACLAGGALFSWEVLKESANDLDFFMYAPKFLTGREVSDQLEALLGYPVHSMSGGQYGDSDMSPNGIHKVFRAYVDGQEVQFICTDDDPHKCIDRFPYSHAQMYWCGGDIQYGEQFSMVRDFNIVVKHYEPSPRYRDKIEQRLSSLGHTLAESDEHALELMLEFMTNRKIAGVGK